MVSTGACICVCVNLRLRCQQPQNQSKIQFLAEKCENDHG